MSRVERAVARNAYGSFERVNGANRLLAALTQNSQQTTVTSKLSSQVDA